MIMNPRVIPCADNHLGSDPRRVAHRYREYRFYRRAHSSEEGRGCSNFEMRVR
jgi:hypothetical protein